MFFWTPAFFVSFNLHNETQQHVLFDAEVIPRCMILCQLWCSGWYIREELAALQAEAARVRKHHERQADLETAIRLGGSDEDLHEPTRNEDVGADAIGAAGTVLGNIFDRGDKLEAPTIEEESGSSDRKNREATSGSLNRPRQNRRRCR